MTIFEFIQEQLYLCCRRSEETPDEVKYIFPTRDGGEDCITWKKSNEDKFSKALCIANAIQFLGMLNDKNAPMIGVAELLFDYQEKQEDVK